MPRSLRKKHLTFVFRLLSLEPYDTLFWKLVRPTAVGDIFYWCSRVVVGWVEFFGLSWHFLPLTFSPFWRFTFLSWHHICLLSILFPFYKIFPLYLDILNHSYLDNLFIPILTIYLTLSFSLCWHLTLLYVDIWVWPFYMLTFELDSSLCWYLSLTLLYVDIWVWPFFIMTFYPSYIDIRQILR